MLLGAIIGGYMVLSYAVGFALFRYAPLLWLCSPLSVPLVLAFLLLVY